MRAQPAGKPQSSELGLPHSGWLYVTQLFVLQGVWARMSDEVVKAWRILDEDLHREEAESPFQLDKSVSHSSAGCMHTWTCSKRLKAVVVHYFWTPWMRP